MCNNDGSYTWLPSLPSCVNKIPKYTFEVAKVPLKEQANVWPGYRTDSARTCLRLSSPILHSHRADRALFVPGSTALAQGHICLVTDSFALTLPRYKCPTRMEDLNLTDSLESQYDLRCRGLLYRRRPLL